MHVRASLGYGHMVTEVAFVEHQGEVGVMLHPALRRPLAAAELAADIFFLVDNDTRDEVLRPIHEAGFRVARVREAHAFGPAAV